MNEPLDQEVVEYFNAIGYVIGLAALNAKDYTFTSLSEDAKSWFILFSRHVTYEIVSVSAENRTKFYTLPTGICGDVFLSHTQFDNLMLIRDGWRTAFVDFVKEHSNAENIVGT